MNNFFNEICEKLRKYNPDCPRLEARMLTGFVLRKDASTISTFEEITPEEQKKISALIEKRISGCPIDKTIGKKSFYKNDFIVNEHVLSPRPDTEILVETAVEIIRQNNFSSLLDLGTGSGCILLSILGDCKNVVGLGLDASQKAVDVAQKNSLALRLQNRTNIICLSWKDANFVQKIGKKFDMIVSNPPYIAETEAADLTLEVRNFDPKEALFAGKDGLDDYKIIAGIVPELLNDGGYILLEVGKNQAAAVRKIFEQSGFVWQKTVKDLALIERCVILKK